MSSTAEKDNPWVKVTSKFKHAFSSTLPRTKLPPSNTIITKGDSGATNHYFALRDKNGLNNCIPSENPIEVTLPNAATLHSTEEANLPFDHLSPTGSKVDIFPGLRHSLISLGQLCDDGCEIKLNKHKLIATKEGKVILEGHRNLSDKLWDIPLPPPPQPI